MEQFIADKNSTLQSLLRSKYNRLSFVSLKKLLNSKDIKVNGKRTGKDIDVFAGDTIEIFAKKPIPFGTGSYCNMLIPPDEMNQPVSSGPVYDGSADLL